MILHRTFTGIVTPYNDANPIDEVSPRVKNAFAKGLKPHGSPVITFNDANSEFVVGQSVMGEVDGKYDRFVGFKDLPDLPEELALEAKDYKIMVGDDDSKFCALIEKMLNDKWSTHGNIGMTSAGSRNIIVQALTRPTPPLR